MQNKSFIERNRLCKILPLPDYNPPPVQGPATQFRGQIDWRAEDHHFYLPNRTLSLWQSPLSQRLHQPAAAFVPSASCLVRPRRTFGVEWRISPGGIQRRNVNSRPNQETNGDGNKSAKSNYLNFLFRHRKNGDYVHSGSSFRALTIAKVLLDHHQASGGGWSWEMVCPFNFRTPNIINLAQWQCNGAWWPSNSRRMFMGRMKDSM